jgi:hypothetical protein
MKAATLLIAAGIILFFLPGILLSLDTFRLEDQVDPFVVTTAAGVTSANITLSQDLYNDETRNASITSNLTTDAAIAFSYTSATNVLLVTGLTADASHYLTVTYSIDALGDYYGAGVSARVIPVLMVLGIMCIVGGACYQAFGRNE